MLLRGPAIVNDVWARIQETASGSFELEELYHVEFW